MSISRVSKPLLVLFVLALLFVSAGVASAQVGKGWFFVDSLRVESDMIVDDDATIQGDLSVGDHAVIGNFLYLTPGTAISLTNGAVLTATNTYQPIDAAPSSTITFTLAAGSAGQMLRLINQGTGTTVLVDTGNQVLASTYSLGQYDSLLLMSDGTRWIEMGRSNN